MRILIAEDDNASRRMLEASLQEWGFDVIQARDGMEAWELLAAPDAPSIAILDYMMPGMDGLEICRSLRKERPGRPVHVILLTSRGASEDVVEGLGAGADDFVVKPFNRNELRARILAGARIVNLQVELSERVRELYEALAQVHRLEGMLPICSYCKKIRDDKNYWHQVETYIGERCNAQFSHGVCPTCYEKILEPELKRLEEEKAS
jgi:DNA-binding response OmpR family regulator